MTLLTIQPDLQKHDLHPLQDTLYHGSAENTLPLFAAESIHLIITSPPYADQRTQTYGGINPDEYVNWFLPISAELFRVLKPDGSFVLNIKERVVNGERHTYVIELILAMRQQGWLWTEEYCWHKKIPILASGRTASAMLGKGVSTSRNSGSLPCIRTL
jgi:DNA modification methylase